MGATKRGGGAAGGGATVAAPPPPASFGKVNHPNGVPLTGDRRSCLTSRLRKTKICSYHLKGTCQYGSDCAFAHSCTELQSTPDLQKTRLCQAFANGQCKDEDCAFAHGEEELRSTNLFYKKILCIWYQKGKCRNGEQCRFAHGTAELRTSKGQPINGTPVRVVARMTASSGTSGQPFEEPTNPMKVLADGQRAAPEAGVQRELRQAAALANALAAQEKVLAGGQRPALEAGVQAEVMQAAALANALAAAQGKVLLPGCPVAPNPGVHVDVPSEAAALASALAAAQAKAEALGAALHAPGQDALAAVLAAAGVKAPERSLAPPTGAAMRSAPGLAMTADMAWQQQLPRGYGMAPNMVPGIPEESLEDLKAELQFLRQAAAKKDIQSDLEHLREDVMFLMQKCNTIAHKIQTVSDPAPAPPGIYNVTPGPVMDPTIPGPLATGLAMAGRDELFQKYRQYWAL